MAVPSSKSSNLIVIEQSGGESRPMATESGSSMSFSPDGRSLAVTQREYPQPNIWISDLETNQPKQLTLEGGMSPIWSLDGLRMAYLKPGTGLVEQTIDSNESSMVLVATDKNCAPLQYTANGMLYRCINPKTAADLYFRSHNGDRLVIEENETPNTAAQISPDGAWIAITRYEGGQPYVYIEPFPARGSRRQLPVVNANAPKWAAGGSALYVTSYDRLMRVPVAADSTTNTIAFGEPTFIRVLGSPVQPTAQPYDVVDDESRIVLVETIYDDLPVQNFVTKWPQLLLD